MVMTPGETTMPSDLGSALATLASHASQLTLATLPPEVVQQARLCVLDTLACILAGTRTAEAHLVLACEPACADEPAASVYGTQERRPLASALRINGYLGDVLELNDLVGGHASIGNVTLALGLAEATGASHGALLEAVARGIEVTSRIYRAVYPTLKRFTECGMVPVGLPSSVGAAAAASRLRGLDEGATAHAMAIAGALAGWCPAEVIFGDGGTMKPMLFGAQPAVAGLTGASYAQRGMTGPLQLLDSPLGYFQTVSTAARPDLAPWSQTWALANPRRKLHACCGYLHSAVDAAAQMRPPTVPHGTPMDVHVPPYTADAVAKSRPPLSPNDARFHLQYCLALVLCGADVIEPDHSIRFEQHVAREDVRSAMARIRVVPDATLTHYEQCRLVARDAHGATLGEAALSAPRGSPGRPLSEGDVLGKFERLATPVLGPRQALRALDLVMGSSADGPAGRWLSELRPQNA
jgi:2-methylcitrate dehydratase PrpD